MPLTQSQRNQIASYRIQIEGYRRDLHSLMEEKRRKSADYASRIKSTSDANNKRSIRQSKISDMNNMANRIASKRQDIARIQGYIKNIRG